MIFPRNCCLAAGFALFLLMIPCLACMGTSGVIAEQDPVLQRLQTGLKQELDRFQKESGIPGASLGFVLSDGRMGAVTAGVSDLEAGTPIKPDDRILAGSIGKTYVAAVALQLVGEGKLELDAPVSRWLGDESWFPRLPNSEGVTVRMLMNHTSGIPEHIYRPEFSEALSASPFCAWRPEELVAFILDAPPLFPAGAEMSYADTNYIVLGMVLEKITGRAFYESLAERILKPFGLNDTLPSDRALIPGLIPGYAQRPSPLGNQGKTMRQGKLSFNPQCEWTGGGLASTPLDLARWAQILCQGKAYPPELLDQALEGVPAFGREDEWYGLGVQIWNSGRGTCLGHGGWFPGYLSLVAFYREFNLSIAVQINADGLPDATEKMRSLMDASVRILVTSS